MALNKRFNIDFGDRKDVIKKVIPLESDYTKVLNTSKESGDKNLYGRDLNGGDIIHNDAIRRLNVEIKTAGQAMTVIEIDGTIHYTNKPFNGSAIETTSFGSINSNMYTKPEIIPTDDVVRNVVNSQSGKLAKLPQSVIDHFTNKFKSSNKFGKYGRNAVENNPGKDIEMVLSVLASEFTNPKQDMMKKAGDLLEQLATVSDSDMIDLSDKSGFNELCEEILDDTIDISTHHVDYDDMVDGYLDKHGYIKVDRQLFHNEFDPIDFDNSSIGNNEQLVVNCRHNAIDLNDWAQVKVMVDTNNISDGRYLCNNCLAPIACQHLENLFNNRPINTWSIVQKNNVYCKICEEFIGHIEQFSGNVDVISEYKYELSQAVVSAIYRATSILRGGVSLAEKLRTIHFKIIYDELFKFNSYLKQSLTWDVKQIVVMYGIMFIYVFATIYMGDEKRPIIFNDEPDVDLKQLTADQLKNQLPGT